MRTLCVVGLFFVLAVSQGWADTQDTTVFRAAMSPDNEVPPVSAPGFSGLSTITVRVTRDGMGNINAATVIFDIDYTVPSATTFTGLHIHNALPGTSAGVVINTGITGSNSVNATGTGHITKVVNYSSGDTNGLKYVTGLLDVPENYYVNIHTPTNPNGVMRAPLLRTSLTLRPQMSPQQEVPAVTDDAEGAATIQIQVNRSNTGAITSGTVTFDVDYRLPPNSTIAGLHIHNGPAGAIGPVVIDSGINGSSRSIATTATGRGNVFRIAEIDSSNTAGLATLTSLLADPTQFYVNIPTTTRSDGIMRGQLSTDTQAFFGQMTGTEEVPVVNTSGTANTMTIVRVTRDTTGNIVSGTVSFNVAYTGFGPITFTGLHIHNAPFGVSAGVVINTGLNGTNNVVDDDGIGSVNIDVPVDGTSSATAQNALRGVLANPERFYVNIHSTTFSNGIVRAQLAREVYHFKAAMSPANEIPPVASTASATGWISVKVGRDENGVINGGQVTFDVNYATTADADTGPVTFTGLHIHSGSAATASGPVVINTGLNGSNTVVADSSGAGNITRVVTIGPAATNSIAMLGTLINSPDQAYVNIHTTVNGSGMMRSQMLPVLNYIPQAAGGGEWITSIRVTNPSTIASVHGIVDTYQSNGSAMPTAIVDPNISFLIPPGGSTTVNLHNQGTLTTGFARVYSSAAVTLGVSYNFPTFPSTAAVTPVTARMVSIPVNVGAGINSTGIAVLALNDGQLLLSLRSQSGLPLPGGSNTINVVAGQHVVGFVRDLLPGVTVAQFTGDLIIESRPPTGTGQLSALALQFDGTLTPVTITPLP